MLNVKGIVSRCGGRAAISESIDSVSVGAIRKWEDFGIPEKHWKTIMQMAKGRLTPRMLNDMNESMRQSETV